MQKILLVITKSNWGGAQRYVYDLCSHLPKNRFNITVAAGGDGPLLKRLEEIDVQTFGIGPLQRNPSPLRDIHSLFLLFQVVRRIRPSILHLNSSKVTLLGAIVGRLLRVPKIVITSHGWPFFEPVSTVRRFAYRLLTTLSILLAHETVTVCRSDYFAAKNLPFVNHARLHLIHNGITTRPKPDRAALRRAVADRFKQTSSWNGTWVAMVGELTRNKGQIPMIDVFARFAPRGSELFIMGDGEDREELSRVINESPIKDRVHLLGTILDAPKILGAFDALLVPSLKEGLPYVILEAGIAGVPVLTRNVGGIPDIISHMHNGILVESEDPTEWGKAIFQLATNPVLRHQLGDSLYETVTKRFSLSSTLDAMRSLYQS